MAEMMRRLAGLAGVAAFVVASGPLASLHATTTQLNYLPIRQPFITVDWQHPLALPRAFRNHCHFDGRGRFFCSNHCGLDYQFYYCTPASFGCCRPGFAYCDWKGHLRCAPW
jgi:hypothetical protein